MTTTIPFTVIKVDADGYHLLIKININDKVAKIIVDTGATKTVFDKKRIKKYISHKILKDTNSRSAGLGGNNIQSHLTTLKKLKVGKLVLKNYDTILLDLSHVNQSYESNGLSAIDGVLGGDILMKYKAVIDYNKLFLKLKYKKLKK